MNLRKPTATWFGATNKHPGVGPPTESIWNLPLEEAPFVFVDLELTGLNVNEDRVIEICIERVVGSHLVERMATLVNPGDCQGSEHIHGIHPQMLTQAPTFQDIASTVSRMLKGAIFVAHGVRCDLAFLQSEFNRMGTHDCVPTHAIDTLILCRRVFYLQSYRLYRVAQSLNISIAQSHRAESDVALLREVWSQLLIELKPTTPRDLWETRIGERTVRADVLSALQCAQQANHPVLITYRHAHKPAEKILFVVTSITLPRIVGYLMPSRGHRVLRADRILNVEQNS